MFKGTPNKEDILYQSVTEPLEGSGFEGEAPDDQYDGEPDMIVEEQPA